MFVLGLVLCGMAGVLAARAGRTLEEKLMAVGAVVLGELGMIVLQNV